MKMKLFLVVAAAFVTLAAAAETENIKWDEATIQSISLGKSFMQNGDTAAIVYAKNGIYMKIEPRRSTKIDFYGRGIYTNGRVFFTPSKGNLTKVIINASQENKVGGWTTNGNQLIWNGNSPYAYIKGDSAYTEILGIQNIEFTVEAKADTLKPVTGVKINETNFPDAKFRSYLLSQSYGKDSIMTDEEIAGIRYLSMTHKGIKNLKGIEYFTVLDTLDCSDNELTSLNATKNTTLSTLWCSYNQLRSLNVTGCKALKDISCYMNKLTGLAMDSLVTSLPVVSSGDMKVIYAQGEQNVMTKAQVEAAKAKGWTPKYLDLSSGWREYAGSDAETKTYSIFGIPKGWMVNGETIANSDTTSTATVKFPEGAKVVFTPANIPAGKKIKSIKAVKKQ